MRYKPVMYDELLRTYGQLEEFYEYLLLVLYVVLVKFIIEPIYHTKFLYMIQSIIRY